MCVVDGPVGQPRRCRVELHRASPQRGDVGGAQPPARPGEHAHRRRRPRWGRPPAAASRRRRPPRAPTADPTSPTTSTGTPRAVSASAIGAASALRRTSTAAVGTSAARSRALRGRRSANWSATQSRSSATSVSSAHRMVPGWRTGPRQQLADRHRPAPRLRRDRVGQMQRARRVAPAGAQLQRGRGRAVRQAEVGGEPRQVGRRRAAPAVDRLDRVADGGQRQVVVDAAAEQRRQRHPLRVAGVLVLVEQHHPVALRAAARRPEGTSRPAAPPPPSACRSPSRSRRASARAARRSAARARCARSGWPACFSSDWLGPRVALPRPGGQGVHQPLELDVGVAQLVGVDEVLGQLAGQPQHHRGDRGRRLLGVAAPGMLAHHAKGQLPQLGFADQPGRRLDRQQQAVLAQQRAREGVVGADRSGARRRRPGRRGPDPRPRAAPAGCGPDAAAAPPPCG